MLCENCKTELRIKRTQLVFEHDDTPDEATEAFIEQTLECVNPQCANRTQKIVRNPWKG
jgi:hypothetical protein